MNAENRHPYVLADGALVASGSANVPVPGSPNPPERGVFTTMKVSGGRPIFFDDHLARLCDSARCFGLTPPRDSRVLYERCRSLIAANQAEECALRIVLYPDAGTTRETLQTREARPDPEKYEHGFRLMTVRRDPEDPQTPAHKTLDYRANLQALNEARHNGFDEALFINHAGDAWECAVSNVFIVKQGVVITPPESSGVLPGIIRSHLLRMKSEVTVREGRLTGEAMGTAGEVFVTNSILGVMPVSAIDGRSIELRDSSITSQLREALARCESRDREPDAIPRLDGDSVRGSTSTNS